jgi:hypothetical protein
MSANVAVLWQRAVKLLQDCSSGSADAESSLQSVQDLLEKLEQLPTPPKAVWKKLVQQLQVCCAQDMLDPSGIGSMSLSLFKVCMPADQHTHQRPSALHCTYWLGCRAQAYNKLFNC